ncbi:MAG: DUF192 domain-containing protein [Candidatus Rehaiarchaeum fermentans]|nr:DUF192 domain-containing protein [Candidatus Rehaiarchaeum fermentans]
MLVSIVVRKKEIGKVIYCDNIWLKLKGLMFTKDPEYGAILFNVNSIHMFFVFSPLRIFWLDKDLRVLKKEIALPWRLYSYEEAVHVLELPISKGREIKEGDKINIKR